MEVKDNIINRPSQRISQFLISLCLCARFCHLVGSGSRGSERRLHSDSHHLWSGWHRWIPHSVGGHACSAFSTHVRHQRHLRLVSFSVSRGVNRSFRTKHTPLKHRKVNVGQRSNVSHLSPAGFCRNAVVFFFSGQIKT